MSQSLSIERGPPTVSLLEEPIGERLRRTCPDVPGRNAVVVRSQCLRATYEKLWQDVGRAAQSLLFFGMNPGDRVGIWSANRYEWVVVQYATARIGAILV